MKRAKQIRVPEGILHVKKDNLTMEEVEKFKQAFYNGSFPQLILTQTDTEIKFVRIARPKNKFRFLLKTGY